MAICLKAHSHILIQSFAYWLCVTKHILKSPLRSGYMSPKSFAWWLYTSKGTRALTLANVCQALNAAVQGRQEEAGDARGEDGARPLGASSSIPSSLNEAPLVAEDSEHRCVCVCVCVSGGGGGRLGG